MKLTRLLMCLVVMLACMPLYAAGYVSVKGKVVDISGKPLAGIKVYTVMQRYDYGLGVNSRRYFNVKDCVETSDDGSFIMAKLPKPVKNSAYVLIAYSPGQYLGWVEGKGTLTAPEWALNEEPDSYQITVYKVGEFKGRIIDENSIGISGVKISMQDLMLSHEGISSDVLSKVIDLKPVITDAKGDYTIPEMPDGVKIGISASKTGYTNTSSRLISDAAPIKMSIGGSISGWIFDVNKEPCEGIQVIAQAESDVSMEMARTGKNGFFRIPGLMPGTYYLIIQDDVKPVVSPGDVEVIAGKDTQVPNLIARDGVEVTGCIIEEKSGKPITGASVMFNGSGANKGWVVISSQTGQDGVFRAHVIPGEMTYFPDTNNPLFVASNKMLRLTVLDTGMKDLTVRIVRSDSAKGKIVDMKNQPVAEAHVKLFMMSGRNGIDAFSDDNGMFEIAVPPDTGQPFG